MRPCISLRSPSGLLPVGEVSQQCSTKQEQKIPLDEAITPLEEEQVQIDRKTRQERDLDVKV